MRSRRDVNIAISVVIHTRLIVGVTIIPITFSDYHNRYTGLKRPTDNKLANKTTFADFFIVFIAFISLLLERFHYIIFLVVSQQFSICLNNI